MTIKLSEANFWKLRALCTDTQRLQVMVQTAQLALAEAQRKQQGFLSDLALQHGFNENASPFQLDDAMGTLTISEEAKV